MLRRLDEIFCANFMVFHDLVEQERFDLWIADEAWEVDYFLHENPELKTAPYVWLTDFVGVLPMPDGGEREAYLAADHNAQMVEHVARHPRLRDRSIFIGDPDDIVPRRSAPACPGSASGPGHFRFAGYITGFEAAEIADRDALRARVGYAPGEQVCLVAAGGSGVGVDLLQRAVAAFPEAKRRVPSCAWSSSPGRASTPRRCRERRPRDARLRPPALPAARGLRHRDQPRRAVDDDGADRGRRPFLYLPAASATSSRTTTSPTGSTATAPGGGWTRRDGPAEIAAALAEELAARRATGRSSARAARAASAIRELL